MKLLLIAIALIAAAVIISNKREQIAQYFGRKEPVVEVATPQPRKPVWERRTSTALDGPQRGGRKDGKSDEVPTNPLERGAYK